VLYRAPLGFVNLELAMTLQNRSFSSPFPFGNDAPNADASFALDTWILGK